MTLSGLTGSPSRYCLPVPIRQPPLLSQRILGLPNFRMFRTKPESLHLVSLWTRCNQRCNVKRSRSINCAMDASFGHMDNDSHATSLELLLISLYFGENRLQAIFPRINIKDPHKRLGISKEASEEEIQSARNFLIQKYAGHQPSVDSIESAHDKILMQKFYERKNPKVNIKKKVRDVTQSRVVQAVTSRFRVPSTNFIIKTSIAFVVLGALTVLFPTEEGPTLQVAISLFTTIYFVYDRLKSKLRAFLYGAGAFVVSWLLGTFLMVSIIPPILKGPTSLEVTTSLISYLLLWVASTYIK